MMKSGTGHRRDLKQGFIGRVLLCSSTVVIANTLTHVQSGMYFMRCTTNLSPTARDCAFFSLHCEPHLQVPHVQ